MPNRIKRLDIRNLPDQEKDQHYEQADALYRQGKAVTVKEHRSGFPAVTVDCVDIHLLTDCLSLEAWWRTVGAQRPKPPAQKGGEL